MRDLRPTIKEALKRKDALYAAAPDLLEAAKEFLADALMHLDGANGLYSYDKLEAAVAKAEGHTPTKRRRKDE